MPVSYCLIPEEAAIVLVESFCWKIRIELIGIAILLLHIYYLSLIFREKSKFDQSLINRTL